MKKILTLIMLMVPMLVSADQRINFEIRLTEITGEIDKYPLEFDLGFYLPEQGGVNAGFTTPLSVSLSEENIHVLNTTHQVPGYELSLKIQHRIVRPINPYIVPNVALRSYFVDNPHPFVLNVKGQFVDLDEFHIIVRTDNWGASTWTSDEEMDIIKYMASNSNVKNQTFDLEDDDVTYHFVIAKLDENGVPECKDGLCQSP